jgi:hypothetical protein
MKNIMVMLGLLVVVGAGTAFCEPIRFGQSVEVSGAKSFTFEAAANAKVFIRLQPWASGAKAVQVRVYGPDGVVVCDGSCSEDIVELSPCTLPEKGTYRVEARGEQETMLLLTCITGSCAFPEIRLSSASAPANLSGGDELVVPQPSAEPEKTEQQVAVAAPPPQPWVTKPEAGPSESREAEASPPLKEREATQQRGTPRIQQASFQPAQDEEPARSEARPAEDSRQGEKSKAEEIRKLDSTDSRIASLLAATDSVVERPEIMDALVRSGAECLDRNGLWLNAERGRKIYDLLKRSEETLVVDSLVRAVLNGQTRLRVLFLGMKLGIPGFQEALVKVLTQHGDKSMAEDFLNSGSADLYDSARTWAQNHGYYISTGMGSHRVAWGAF